MCAYVHTRFQTSTTHWQNEWTAPKILEVHSAYDVNEATGHQSCNYKTCDSYMNR